MRNDCKHYNYTAGDPNCEAFGCRHIIIPYNLSHAPSLIPNGSTSFRRRRPNVPSPRAAPEAVFTNMTVIVYRYSLIRSSTRINRNN